MYAVLEELIRPMLDSPSHKALIHVKLPPPPPHLEALPYTKCPPSKFHYNNFIFNVTTRHNSHNAFMKK
jgi:hypothetical protein